MNLYDQLGVPPNADADDIRAAHRKLAKKHHPDKGGNREDFDKVQHAYLVLRDPKTRARYDETGQDEVAPDNELSEIANMLVQAFDMATGSCGGAFDTIDLATEMRRSLVGRMAEAKANLANFKAGATAIEKIMKRLSYKGDRSDLIGGMLRNRLADSQKAQAKITEEIETIERAQAYAKDYGYQFDARAPQDPWMQSAQTSTSGGRGFFNTFR